MEAISYLSNWITWLYAVIIVGAGCMVTYEAVMKSFATDEDDINRHNIRIKQTLKGAVVGLCLSGLITIIKNFYM
jgi:putative Mn2+ efflux pump MntP